MSVNANPASGGAGGSRWPVTAASVAVGSAFFALWFWLLPTWLKFRVDTSSMAAWRWITALPSVAGFAVALRCIWDFGWTGRGTPAPIVPPRQLVIVGFYRYVRNPMYVGFIAGWIGLWVVFGRADLRSIIVAIAVLFGLDLFVRLYEEPTLRRQFGSAYEEYLRNVPRWIPRITPWRNYSGG